MVYNHSIFSMLLMKLMCHGVKNVIGSMDISWGIDATTSLEGCTHRLADVGNRVHTRNDSDEDVRGNACKKDSLEGFTLVFPLHKQITVSWNYMLELNVKVKPSRLLSTCSFLTRALPPVTNIG